MNSNPPIPPTPQGYTDAEWQEYNRDPCTRCIRELRNVDREIRCNAADILRGLGYDALPAIPSLVACTADINDIFRGYCVHAISDIAWAVRIRSGTTHSSLVAAIPEIVKLLQDTCDDVVVSAIIAIEAIGPDAVAAVPLLNAIAASRAEELRNYACKAINALSQRAPNNPMDRSGGTADF